MTGTNSCGGFEPEQPPPKYVRAFRNVSQFDRWLGWRSNMYLAII